MAKAAKNEIAKPQDEFSYLETMNKVDVPQDNFDSTDVVIPRIKLLQPQSEELELFPDTARAGCFWHTGGDISLGADFSFIACTRKKMQLLVAPIEDGQNLLARADDCKTWDRSGRWEIKLKDIPEKVVWEIPADNLDVDDSGLTAWGSSNPANPDSSPAATLFYEYLVICPEHLDLGPAVISLARSNIRKAKKGLNDKIAMQAGRGRPMQALLFKASSVEETNSNNQKFKNWRFQADGFNPEPLYKQAAEIAEVMKDYKVADEAGAAHDEGKAAKVESEDF